MSMYMRSDFAAMRVRKDVNELAKAKFTCSQAKTRVEFPDGANNMLQLIFTISIIDLTSPFANGDFNFLVDIPKTYPFHAPSVRCLTRVWHPNIDIATGKVMMSILGRDWRPVLSINTVLLGLQLIFLEPAIDYALNSTAADQLHRSPEDFKKEVQQILCGGTYYGLHFPPHPRQIEMQRQSWSLRMKRPREDDLFAANNEWGGTVSPNASDTIGIEASVLMDCTDHPTWKRARIE
ncbi:protein [Plasmopara halstedii]|uniref:Protein n=1 Tax=Plasmopara halstedii TaxID=4781 RepID=A0A0P1AWI7_PLAHL|nr:protein [Plasmopara halstedii]CEG44934.1 protein [Plasmopara halstedii]|eukprot:XP_024581303.1 protein [Plasmopara halstedii]